MSGTWASVWEMVQQSPSSAWWAAAFGTLGLACQLIWPLFVARRAILGVQLGIGTNYGIQYALLDAWSGVGVCALGATQTAIAFIFGNRPWLKKMGFVFLPLLAVISSLTWSGLPSLFAVCACGLIMMGRLQKDTISLRWFLLAAAPFGISYDISVGAVVALCGSALSALIAAVMLRREILHRRDVVNFMNWRFQGCRQHLTAALQDCEGALPRPSPA